MNEVKAFLKNILKPKDCVVVACSAGPDSMCLLHVLENNFDLNLVIAHVNHGVRKASLKEAAFLKNYCESHHLIYEYFEINKYQNNKFTESEARSKRYAFFKNVMTKYKAQYLMTAHHGNDLEETILMRLVRGSNLKGYIGIERINGNMIRPLLTLSKKDILQYNQDNHIKYFLDKSNNNLKYTRNRYRKQVLPLLEKEDKNVHQKFFKYSTELSKYYYYVDNIINQKIKEIYKDNKLNISLLNKEDKFIQEKLLEKVISEKQKDYLFNITDKQKEDILALLSNNKNKEITLSNGFIARRSYNNLIIEKNNTKIDYDYLFKEHLEINNYIIEKVFSSNEKSNYIIRINSKEVTLPLHIRNMQKGDIMLVKNLNGKQKLSDIFINEKIDIKKREMIPIVTDNENRIIWIPGIKKSIFDKDISEKYDIILKCREEKNE